MTISRKETFSIQLVQIVDCALILLGFWLGLLIRNVLVDYMDFVPYLDQFPQGYLSVQDIAFWGFGITPFIPYILEKFNFYRNMRLKKLSTSLIQMIQGLVTVIAIFGGLSVILKIPHQSRLFLLVSSVFIILLLLARIAALKAYYRAKMNRQILRVRLALIGSEENCKTWFESLVEEEQSAVDLHFIFPIREQDLDSLEKKLVEHAIEKVIIHTSQTPFEKVSQVIELCETLGVESCLDASFIRARIASPSFETVLGQPMLVLRTTPSMSWSYFLKNVMDKVGALLLILLSSPLWIIAAIGIAMSDKGPLFFRQDRAGKYGKPFKMWKFRTMCVNAEAKLAQLKEEQGNQMSGPVFKLDNDPRIFPFGRFLRKTSIDELPQLLNVLLGDMSLVGPRPMACYELPDIEKTKHRRKMSVKPGITCIWQVEGRNTITDFDEWVDLDLKYIDNWSLWLDIKLLLKTLPAVLFSKGAK